MAAPKPTSSNPLIGIAIAGVGVLAAFVGNQVLEKGWGAVFGEDAPTEKMTKQNSKETQKARKEAKKEGRSKEEIAQIDDPADALPVWKLLLWTALSGVVVQGLKLLAQRGTQQGLERLTERRPRSNRG